MASPTQSTRVWANAGRQWRTGGARCAAVHGVAKSQRQLSDWATQPSEGTHPVHTLTSNFWLTDLSDENFLLFQPLHLWYLHTNTNTGRTCLGLFYLIFKILFIDLFLFVLGLHCCGWAFSSCHERGPLFIAVPGLLTVVASLAVAHRF